MFAMHARHRLMIELWLVRRTGMVGVDANPMHLATTRDLIFSDDRNVVLCLAGNRAGIAADAGVEIDDHAPGIAVVGELIGIEQRLVRRRFRLVRQFALCDEFRQRAFSQNVATFHRMMVLRRGESMFRTRLTKRETIAMPERIGGPQCVGIGTNIVSDATGGSATVAKMKGHGIFRLARRDPDWRI